MFRWNIAPVESYSIPERFALHKYFAIKSIRKGKANRLESMINQPARPFSEGIAHLMVAYLFSDFS
jgi:hypothetical protein